MTKSKFPKIPKTLSGIILLGEKLNEQNILAEQASKAAAIPSNVEKWNTKNLWKKNFDDVLNKRFRLHWTWMRATEPEALVKLLRARIK